MAGIGRAYTPMTNTAGPQLPPWGHVMDHRDTGTDWVLVGGLTLWIVSLAITAVIAINIFR